MAREEKRKSISLMIGGILYFSAILVMHFVEMEEMYIGLIYLPSYLILIINVLWQMMEGIRKEMISAQEKKLKSFIRACGYFTDSILIILAATGAMLIMHYKESVAALLFFQFGKLAEYVSMESTKRAVSGYMNIQAEQAHLKRGVQCKDVSVKDLEVRQIIEIRPGEIVPVDAVVTQGNSFLDMKALTGEAVPKEVKIGSYLYSGSENQEGTLEARVLRTAENSTAAKILRLVEMSNEKQSESQLFTEVFLKRYTAIVTVMGILVMFLPAMITGSSFSTWIYRGLIFLIAACPFGTLVSVPMAFLGGVGAAARKGILIKGSRYLEVLLQTETFVFDKTGTLTEGTFKVQDICPRKMKSEELLELMAYAEAFSEHPIAVSLRAEYGKEIDTERITGMQEITGFGVQAEIDKKQVLIGNTEYLNRAGIACPKKITKVGTQVHVAVDGQYEGYAVISDVLRADTKRLIRWLTKRQIETIILTGDNEKTARSTAKELGITHIYADLMPENKVDLLAEFMEDSVDGEKLAYVGDGMNDAPALARADVGIAMGGLGSDAALEVADIILMEDEPSKIVKAIDIARETVGSVKQNFVFAVFMKILLLALAFFGLVSMQNALIAEVGVMLIGVLNSFWILYT